MLTNFRIFQYCFLNNKENDQKIRLKTYCTKKPFGYRVVHRMFLRVNKS